MRWPEAVRHAAGLVGRIAAAVLVAGFAWPAAAQSGPPSDVRRAFETSQAAIGNPIGDFELRDASGKTVRLSDYRGKPLLVSFIYTGCFEICPANTRLLHEAVKGLDKLLSPNQFNVVSIGFNQPADAPVAMRAFAAQYRINYPNWEFLSPHAKTVDPLTRAYGFSYLATPAGFDHVLGVTIVDPNGKIYTQVWGDNITALKLGEPLRQLLGRAPLKQKETFADLVERVRILCTVYDPETGTYRFKYALVMELIGGAIFFLSMAWYFIAELLRNRKRRRRERLAHPRLAEGASH